MKTIFGIVSAATMFATPSLFASIIGTGQLTITAPGLASGDVDGPYYVAATPTSGSSAGTSFETFCIGSQVDFYSGQSYGYQISTTVSAFGSAAYVTLGTAWLYSQFAAGHLGPNTVNANNSGTANDMLQQAIWFLQGQTGGVNNADVTAAIAAVGSGYLGNANGAFGVYALNLIVNNGGAVAPGDPTINGVTYAQPQLCIVPGTTTGGNVPVPEPGTLTAGALLLLPLAASAVRILRKSKNQ